MEYLTTFINIYYMLTFMAASYFVLRHVKLPKQVNTCWWVLVIGIITGIVFLFISKDCTLEVLITTFAIGTSFYELVIQWVLKKLNL